MSNSNESTLDLIGVTKEKEREYKDRHFITMWRLISTSEALEELKNPETLKNLKQLI